MKGWNQETNYVLHWLQVKYRENFGKFSMKWRKKLINYLHYLTKGKNLQYWNPHISQLLNLSNFSVIFLLNPLKGFTTAGCGPPRQNLQRRTKLLFKTFWEDVPSKCKKRFWSVVFYAFFFVSCKERTHQIFMGPFVILFALKPIHLLKLPTTSNTPLLNVSLNHGCGGRCRDIIIVIIHFAFFYAIASIINLHLNHP